MHYLDKFRYCPACGSEHFEVNDFKSKRCADCGFTYYFNAASACVAIIENERGEYLLCRRACQPAEGTLDLIGGFADAGESNEQSMIREIKEETGLEVKADRLHYLFSLPNTYMYSGMLIHTCDSFYHVRVSSDSDVTAHDDVSECMWMSVDTIHVDDIGLDSVREGMRRYINTIRYK